MIQGVTGAPLAQVIWGSIPFLAILLGAGVLLALVPGLALWLPGLVM